MSSCHTSTGGGGSAPNAATDKNINYQEFGSKAKGDRSYGMNPEEVYDTENFFERYSNFAELIGLTTSKDRDAFDEWSVGTFMEGQMYKQFSKLSKREQEWIKSFDKILDQSELKQGIVVKRLSTPELIFGKGKTKVTLEELQAAKGKIVTCKSCLSTGAAAEGLKIGSWQPKQIEYSIKIPPGKGRGMWIGDRRINPTWGAEQREFMVNRDAAYKIGNTKYNSTRKVFEVEIEMIAVNTGSRHDYS